MADSYILALDSGTTSSRAIVFDRESQIVALAQKEFDQHYPQPGWVEHDPNEIWSSQQEVAFTSLREAGLRASQIAAIGITNQRETTLAWDRKSGRHVCNAIVWQDRRTSRFCDELKDRGMENMVRD